MTRFRVQHEDWPCVIDGRDGTVAYESHIDIDEDALAEVVAALMNDTWRRDVDFVAEWLDANQDGPWTNLANEWREDMKA